MKKRIGVIVTALIVTGLLATEIAGAAEPVTLRVFMGWGSIPTIVEIAVEHFEKTHPDVHIEPVEIVGDMDGLMVQLIGGAAPDVFMVRAEHLASFATKDLLLDLTSRFERDMDMDDYLPMFTPSMVDGRYYGIPAEGGGYRTEGMYVNRDIFREAGIQIPGPKIEDALTFEAWRDLAKRLTIDSDGDGIPEQWGTNFRTSRWEFFLPPNGVTIFNEDHSDTLVDTAEAIEVMRLLQDLRVTDMSAPMDNVSFATGTVATTVLWRSRVASFKPEIQGAFDWSVAPIPAGKAGSVGVIKMNTMAINADTPYPDLAWEFLQSYLSEPVQAAIAATGRAVALRSVALNPDLVISDVPPYDISSFLYGDSVSVLLNEPPSGMVRPQAVTDALSRLWAGEISPEAAAQIMAESWRNALKEAGLTGR